MSLLGESQEPKDIGPISQGDASILVGMLTTKPKELPDLYVIRVK